jgi:AraC-like DNA-binding protein
VPLTTLRTHPHHLKEPLAVEARHLTEIQFGLHMHNGLELGICLSGSTERRSGSHARLVAAGQAWLVGMWEPHAWTVAPDSTLVHFYFVPDVVWDPADPMPSWFRMFSASPEERPQAQSPAVRQQLMEIAREVAEEAERQEVGWLRVARLALMRVLVAMEREWYRSGHSVTQTSVAAEDLARMALAVALVNENLHRRVPAEEAAAASSLSTSRFQHVFRATFGVPYGRFCLRARLAAAAALLLNSAAGVDTLAGELGFTDASHLRRAFHAEYGLNTGDLRKQRQFQGQVLLPSAGPEDPAIAAGNRLHRSRGRRAAIRESA